MATSLISSTEILVDLSLILVANYKATTNLMIADRTVLCFIEEMAVLGVFTLISKLDNL